ncbi:ceramide synthase 6 isoform X1, partial [Tachysurus ichikawai]
VSKDDRSDIESSSDEEEVAPSGHKHHTNGTNGSHGTNGFLSSTCHDEH